MGKDKKQSFADKLKAGIAKAGDEASKVAKKGLGAAKDGADVLAKQATKAAKAGANAAREGAQVAAKTAEGAKSFVDAKAREMLDKAYVKKKDLAIEKVRVIRSKMPDATPSEIHAELEKELRNNEVKLGADSETFSTAVTAYVLATFEVHGAKPSDSQACQKLVDTVLVLDSEVSKGLQLYGGLAVELLAGRVKTIGKVAKVALEAGNKLSKFQPLIQLLGIKNLGKQSISMVVIGATKNALGEFPESWESGVQNY
jgi:uncharacterized phage infection (PIP) family protein YhgE